MTYGKLKNQNKISEELSIQMLDFVKELEDMEFETKTNGRELIAWLGALSMTIRFTQAGNTVITRYGAKIVSGHEEKLDLSKTYDYVSSKISNYLKDKDNGDDS